ncbi:MAG: glutamate dehydrogenase, partial [Micromonosporaceae bacterium]|nr:glutamate dehydrogenase [Micromonosporaceae bacterium]
MKHVLGLAEIAHNVVGEGSAVMERRAATGVSDLSDVLVDDAELDRPLPNAERLIAAAVTLTAARSDDPDLAALVAQYWRLVSDEELAGRTPANLRAATLSHLALADQRLPGQLKLRITASDENAEQDEHTAIEIVTDDMPFLVDSVTAALSARDVNIHLLAHPLVVVRRDPSGSLREIRTGVEPSDA